MSNLRFLLLFALMLAGMVAGASLVARPKTTVNVRRELFTLTVLGTLMPYAIHGLQVYESLTTVSSGAGLAVGRYPVLDRWIVSLLLLIILLTLAAWQLSRTKPFTGIVIPVVMGAAYLYGFLPYALGHQGSGTSATAPPKSWLMWAILVGVVLTAAAARRVSQVGSELSSESVSDRTA